MTSIIDALDDPALLGATIRGPETFAAWRTFLRAVFALPSEPGDGELFAGCTGRTDWPTTPASEVYAICGRRSRKTLVLSMIAVFLAAFRDWRDVLAPGEFGYVPLIAVDKRQAGVAMRYIRALLRGSPMLARMVENDTAESITLSNRAVLEVFTASFRAARGRTILSAIIDEAAFLPSDDASAEPDRELVTALNPAMATVPGAMLLVASSPYARRGIIWEARRRHWGVAGSRALVWQAPTLAMNPTIAKSVVDGAIERDAAVASSEWLAEFRSDIESYVAREAVEACVAIGTRERPPMPGVRYRAFCDPSGGTSDSFTLAIGHQDGEAVALDAIREVRPPFSPEAVVADFAELLQRYRVTTIGGDRYAGEWPREQFRKRGIDYRQCELPKSDLYRELLPLLNTRGIGLLDDSRLVGQIAGLERRVGRGGRDSIDHAPGAHDDLANAVAGVAWLTGEPTRRGEVRVGRIQVDGRITWEHQRTRPAMWQSGGVTYLRYPADE